MTKTYKSYICKEDLRQILEMFKERIIAPITMWGGLIWLAAALIFLTIKATTWFPELAAKSNAVTRLTLVIVCMICAGIIAVSAVKLMAYSTTIVAFHDMEHYGHADGSSYSILRMVLASDKLPKDKSREADMQELLLATWLCMNEHLDHVEFNPGDLPNGKVEVLAKNEHESYVETFMLPATNRILEYRLGYDKQKQVWLKREPIRKVR